MNGTELIDAVAGELVDTSNARWSRADVAGFVSRAMTWVVTVRPDANTVTETVQLAEGSAQSLSSLANRALRFQGAVRNMGDDGNSPGRSIRDTEKATMDRVAPSWHLSAPRSTIRDALFDANRPDAFWAYPPIPSTPAVYAELMIAKNPAEVTTSNENDTVDLTDEYREPVIAYAVGLALRRQTDTGSLEASQLYTNLASQQLGGARQAVANAPPATKSTGA